MAVNSIIISSEGIISMAVVRIPDDTGATAPARRAQGSTSRDLYELTSGSTVMIIKAVLV